jgi:hypothetical protein
MLAQVVSKFLPQFQLAIEHHNPGSAVAPDCTPAAREIKRASPAVLCRGDLEDVNR